MNEVIYKGQRIKIQLNSKDSSNNNTGIDLSTAIVLKIKIQINGTATAYDATVVPDDNYSCYINYDVTSDARHKAWIYAEISASEKYIGIPFEFDPINEGELPR